MARMIRKQSASATMKPTMVAATDLNLDTLDSLPVIEVAPTQWAESVSRSASRLRGVGAKMAAARFLMRAAD